MKRFIEIPKRVMPKCNQLTCQQYFQKAFQAVSPRKLFCIPAWIPTFQTPEKQFNNAPPSYRQVTNIIRRMKASGSTCQLDQISIIVFKKCPYLRSFIHAVITKVLITNQIPETWKRAVTILAYKKGDESEPQNFRPITLESVPLKIFTSFLRNRIYEFLKDNKAICAQDVGTFEHTYHLSHLISHARKKQRFLTVTLLDLRNAFGEVHHNLIKSVLEYNICLVTLIH